MKLDELVSWIIMLVMSVASYPMYLILHGYALAPLLNNVIYPSMGL